MISLKEYAKKKNVSYEAVRKQVNRYREDLGTHLVKTDRTQFLDEEAEAFLDARRAANPVVVVEQEKDDKIKELERQNINLLTKVAEQADKIAELLEYKADNAVLIAQAESKLLLAEKDKEAAVAEAQAAAAEDKAAAVEQARAEMQAEIDRLRSELETEKQKSWLKKLFRR